MATREDEAPYDRWSDPAPTNGRWDPRGATPEQRRQFYDTMMGRSRWVLVAFFGYLAVGFVIALVAARRGDGDPAGNLIQAWLFMSVIAAMLVLSLRRREILGEDPEDPFEQVTARQRQVRQHHVYPVVGGLQMVMAALTLALVPRWAPAAGFFALVGLVLLTLWWRRRGR